MLTPLFWGNVLSFTLDAGVGEQIERDRKPSRTSKSQQQAAPDLRERAEDLTEIQRSPAHRDRFGNIWASRQARGPHG